MHTAMWLGGQTRCRVVGEAGVGAGDSKVDARTGGQLPRGLGNRIYEKKLKELGLFIWRREDQEGNDHNLQIPEGWL